MMCSHCTGRVEQVLRALSGVTEVQMDLEGKCAVVTAEDLTDETLAKAVTDSGYTVTGIS